MRTRDPIKSVLLPAEDLYPNNPRFPLLLYPNTFLPRNPDPASEVEDIFNGNGSSVFFTVPDTFGGELWHVKAGPDSVHFEPAWQTPLDSCQGNMLLHGGRLYLRYHDKLSCYDISRHD